MATEDTILNIGPQHTSTHGVLRVVLELDGEVIVRAEPVIGYMHRAAEKLAEFRDARQTMVLMNRHDSDQRVQRARFRDGGGDARRHRGTGASAVDPRTMFAEWNAS